MAASKRRESINRVRQVIWRLEDLDGLGWIIEKFIAPVTNLCPHELFVPYIKRLRSIVTAFDVLSLKRSILRINVLSDLDPGRQVILETKSDQFPQRQQCRQRGDQRVALSRRRALESDVKLKYFLRRATSAGDVARTSFVSSSTRLRMTRAIPSQKSKATSKDPVSKRVV